MILQAQRILVGISLGADTTPELGITNLDRVALDHAKWLARVSGGSIHLHHSIDWVGFDPVAAVPDLADAALERANSLLAVVVEECVVEGLRCTASSSIGPAWSEMLAAARSFSADLIVIGPRAHSNDLLGVLTYGSTAQKLARKAPCSVWVVRPAPHGGPPKRAAVMVDLKGFSGELVELGNWMRGHLGMETELVHCVDFPADIALQRLPNASDALRKYHAEVLVDALKRIEALLGDTKPEWRIELSDVWITQAAETLATERGVDVIVVAATTHPGLAGFFLGSTAAKLVRRAPCSALVVRGPVAWVSPD